jgi:hypothetical protein
MHVRVLSRRSPLYICHATIPRIGLYLHTQKQLTHSLTH